MISKRSLGAWRAPEVQDGDLARYGHTFQPRGGEHFHANFAGASYNCLSANHGQICAVPPCWNSFTGSVPIRRCRATP